MPNILNTILEVSESVMYDKKQYDEFKKVIKILNEIPDAQVQPIIELLKRHVHLVEELGLWHDSVGLSRISRKKLPWTISNNLAHDNLYRIKQKNKFFDNLPDSIKVDVVKL